METKRCWKCTHTKPLTEFHKNRTTSDGYEQVCKPCKANESALRRQRRASAGLCHCGRERKIGYNTCSICVEKSLLWGRSNPNKKEDGIAWRKSVRARIFAHYGKQCACCGFSCQDFLTINHINGGGNQHRKEVGGGTIFYSWLIRHNFPSGFNTLCYNCNCAAGHNGGICPHKTSCADSAKLPAGNAYAILPEIVAERA